jgi:hypothetical protein
VRPLKNCRSGKWLPRPAITRFHETLGASAPSASTITILVGPAVVMTVSHNVRAAHHTANHSANDRAGRSGNDGSGAGSDGDAFQRPGLGRNRQERQR